MDNILNVISSMFISIIRLSHFSSHRLLEAGIVTKAHFICSERQNKKKDKNEINLGVLYAANGSQGCHYKLHQL